jgi:SanA protein
LYTNLIEIPSNKVGVILGTSKYLSNGAVNNYFSYRIDAAEKLFFSNKITYILVSGDNSTIHYNEPITIKNELITRGIPADRIILDYAGFRTFDSMIRAHKVFGQDKFTVISQPFHNERAIFIARKNGINAIGYNAMDVTYKSGFKTQLREKFARIKVLLDIYVLNTQPKFLGKKVHIP